MASKGIIGEQEKANLKKSIENIQVVSGDFKALVASNKDNIGRIVNNLETVSKDIESGKGTIGKLVKDETLYNDAKDVVASLKTVSKDIEQGKGTFGKLAKDEALYTDVRKAVDNITEITDGIKKGEGTFGKLAKDESLYNETEKAMKKVQKAAEGIQELTPITILGTIFGSFFLMQNIKLFSFPCLYSLLVLFFHALARITSRTRTGRGSLAALRVSSLRMLFSHATLCKLLFLLFLLFPSTLWAVWPLSWELDGEKRFLGPLISYDEENQEKHLVVRPFLFSYDSEEGGSYNYLFPLGKSRRRSLILFPSIFPNEAKQKATRRSCSFLAADRQRAATAVFSPSMENSTIDSRRMKWVLFSGLSIVIPMMKARRKQTFSGLFSLFMEVLTKGFKAWPIYGNHERPGVRKQQFFLWPVFFTEEKNLDTDEPVHSFFAIPFYLRSHLARQNINLFYGPFLPTQKTAKKKSGTCPGPFIPKQLVKRQKDTVFFLLFRK